MGPERSVADLLEVLKMEVRCFATVIELLILEEKCLVACDTVGLTEVIDRQRDVLTSISCLEKSRFDLLAKIALEFGKKGTELTLADLAGMVGDPLKKDLVDTGAVLGTVYEDMKRKKVANTLLIRQGMMMVEGNIRVLMSALGRGAEKSAVYNPGGVSPGTFGGIRIDGRM